MTGGKRWGWYLLTLINGAVLGWSAYTVGLRKGRREVESAVHERKVREIRESVIVADDAMFYATMLHRPAIGDTSWPHCYAQGGRYTCWVPHRLPDPGIATLYCHVRPPAAREGGYDRNHPYCRQP